MDGAVRYEDPSVLYTSRTAEDKPASKPADAEADFKQYLEKTDLGQNVSVELKEVYQSPDLYYLHGDHLGTATFVTNSQSQATQFFLNLPFGETMMEQMDGSYDNPFKFNAKELDDDTGLYYYGARYYNTRLSIWYGVDPLAVYNPVMETEFYGDGQHNGGVFFWGNNNPYIYTYQNPIRYIDPNGKQTDVVREGVLINENFTSLRYSQKMLPAEKQLYNARQYMFMAALNQKTEDNTTHIYSHGNDYSGRTALIMFDKRKKEGESFSGKFNAGQLKSLFNHENIDTNFLDKKGGNIILHGCYAGAGEGSVAADISRENPEKLVVGATLDVWYHRRGEEIGTYNKAGEKGKWNVFKNGKVVKSFNWDWKPNAKDLKKIK